jgi:pimeloyl-ACP methyl ester carboxylesterase
VLREGSGEPLVLLHGITSDEHTWRHVVPLLAPHHDVIVPTALGHHRGPAPGERPATIAAVTDETARQLDELGLDRAHIAGNSMGGWEAIELARRGRALSVCALSPAGCWEEDWDDSRRVLGALRRAARDGRRARSLLPLLARPGRFRHWAMRWAAAHGERVSREEFLERTDAMLGCVILDDLLDSGERLAPLDPVPCPITLAWSAEDWLFPVDPYGTRAQQLIPEARFTVLDDVGHVPMFDDPKLVADAILESTGALSTTLSE